MKKVIFVLYILSFIFGCENSNSDNLVSNTNKENYYNQYYVKSGAIEYTITDFEKQKNINTEKLLFNDFGKTELIEEILTNSESKIIENKLKKIENNYCYEVDFKSKIIKRNSIKTKKYNQYDKIKLGNEIYKGYDCEIWKIGNTRQLLYKGVPLKIETRSNKSIKIIKEAVTANFNIIISKEDFKLPNYSIVTK